MRPGTWWATTEQMLLHMNTAAGRPAPIGGAARPGVTSDPPHPRRSGQAQVPGPGDEDQGNELMDFDLTAEQRLIIDVARDFTHKELFPYEEEVERSGRVRPELVDRIRSRAIAAGIYAANMPEEYGGAGLDPLTLALVERELGAASYALQYIVARPSNILQACRDEQVDRYLLSPRFGETGWNAWR